MYTECPACHTAFRVTAKALQQASGRVRCGDCGNAFSALDYLTEDFPEAGPHDAAAGSSDASDTPDDLATSNRALHEELDELDELAGPEKVWIEDTGIEWRVLNEIVADDATSEDGDEIDAGDTPVLPPDGPQRSLELENPAQTPADPSRFDDDTPHPDSFAHGDAQPAVPQRRADDLFDARDAPEFDDAQTDFILSEPGDWSELLDEVRDSGSGIADIPLEVEEELAAIHSELSAREGAAVAAPDDQPGDRGFAAEAAPTGDGGDDRAGEGDAAGIAAEAAPTGDGGDDRAGAGDAAGFAAEAAPAGDGGDELDTDPDDPAKLFMDDSLEVETIIMEGDSVRNAIEPERPVAAPEAVEQCAASDTLFDTGMASRPLRGGRRRTDPAGYGVIAGTVLLALLLAGQVIHTYRETLSTYGLFNRTIGPVYRLLGNPVTPAWNIRGWQFEATNGNVAEDDNVLTIFSRISNKSQLPLPYPLVHVSLTDRWEEVIGSRVLTPDEYLAGDLDPGRPVIPGDNFTAVITIDEPSAEATGFKLEVCYRIRPGRVRCATENFKN